MGLSWGVGGVVVIILGQWAQHTSITSAYRLLLGVAAVLVVLAFLLPTRHAHQGRSRRPSLHKNRVESRAAAAILLIHDRRNACRHGSIGSTTTTKND